jgi:hypothetical protein
MDDDEEKKEDYNFESKSTREMSATEQMREYVEKMSGGGLDNKSLLANEKEGINKQSTVASKNDMGGKSSNIVRGDKELGVEANKGNLKGAALNGQDKKENSAGNVNVPGGKASKSMKPMSKGHGAEKKGSSDTAVNKKSLLGGK